MKQLSVLKFKTLFIREKKINTARRTVISFAIIILVGALLLTLPVSSKSRETTDFLTALFTATSATCVTGLVVVETGAYFSLFGQTVILLLIQIGGLGFMSMLTMAFVLSGKSIGMRERMLIVQSLGLFDMSGVVKILKHVMIYTFFVEFIGALLLSFRFIPQYGLKGIWYSLFHSVSAFCNAGFDIFGKGTSLSEYSTDAYILVIISSLIILGGIGFIVVEDINAKRSIKKLSVYSKIVLTTTLILIFAGMVLILLTEWNNTNFLGDGLFNKLLTAYFQSVTTRTAGFDSSVQSNLTDGGKLVSTVLMMIGGASGSTAGGVKVATFAVVAVCSVQILRGYKNFVIFKHKIDSRTALSAMSLISLWLVMVFGASIFISARNNLNIIDCLFEVASAYGTVGLTTGVVSKSDSITRLVFILYMFFGRVGLMTISMMFITRIKGKDLLEYPSGNIVIG